LKKSILSLFLLGLFVYGVKVATFFPSLEMFRETHWNLSLFPVFGLKKAEALLWLFPVGLGFLGWVRWIRRSLLKGLDGPLVRLLAFAITLSLFSFYCFALGVNQVLTQLLVAAFFAAGFISGFYELKEIRKSFQLGWESVGVVVLIWGFDYLRRLFGTLFWTTFVFLKKFQDFIKYLFIGQIIPAICPSLWKRS